MRNSSPTLRAELCRTHRAKVGQSRPLLISNYETFVRDMHILSEMRTQLVRLADAVSTRLRKAGVGARTLTLKVRFSDGFHTITRSTTYPEAIDSAETIVEVLGPIMETIDPTPGIRLLGVSGSNLGPVFHQMT